MTRKFSLSPYAIAVYALVLVVSAKLISIRAADISPPNIDAARHPILDFESLYLTGELALQGRLACAYDPACMAAAETAKFGVSFFHHIALPPPYALLLAALAVFSLPVAYVIFSGASLLAYLLVLKALAGENATSVLLVFLPSIAGTLMSGQSGFLTAALLGAACLGLTRGAAYAGGFMGLMLIKPHLAFTLATTTLCLRAWRTVAVALATIAALGALCTMAFGPGVWSAFLSGAAESGKQLLEGQWTSVVMISVYRAATALGASLEAARFVQGAATLAVLGSIYVVSRRATAAQTAGFALLAACLASPYFFVYDFLIASIGVALLLPSIAASGAGRKDAMLLMAFAASVFPIAEQFLPSEAARLITPATVEPLLVSLMLMLAWSAIASQSTPAKHLAATRAS